MGERQKEYFEVPKALLIVGSDSGSPPALPDSNAGVDVDVPSSTSGTAENAPTGSVDSAVGPIAATSPNAAVDAGPIADVDVATATHTYTPAPPAVVAVPIVAQDKDCEFHVITAPSSQVPDGVRFWTEEKEPGIFHTMHHRYYVVEEGAFSIYRRAIPTPPFGNDLMGFVC